MSDPRKLTDAQLEKLTELAFETGRRLSDELESRRPKDPAPKPLAPEAIYDAIAPTVVAVRAAGVRNASGTGFLYRPGIVVTNFHVVAGASKVSVELAEGRTVGIERVMWSDRETDLATLKMAGNWQGQNGALHPVISLPDFTFSVTMKPREVRVGSVVYAVGNPLGLKRTITSGLVSGARDGNGFFELFQISIPVSPGSSGSPVVDQYGRLIGVVTSSLWAGQNINFCIPICYLRTSSGRSMSLDEWAAYSRSVTLSKLPPADGKLYDALRKSKDGDQIWRLRSLTRMSIVALDERPHRDGLVKIAVEEIGKRAPSVEVTDASSIFDEGPLKDLATRPRAKLMLSVDAVPVPTGGVWMSYSLSLSREACLRSEALDEMAGGFIDRASVDAEVWSQYGRVTGTEVEARRKLEAEIRGHLAELARWIELANPR